MEAHFKIGYLEKKLPQKGYMCVFLIYSLKIISKSRSKKLAAHRLKTTALEAYLYQNNLVLKNEWFDDVKIRFSILRKPFRRHVIT